MLRSLVGSEMCIRDRSTSVQYKQQCPAEIPARDDNIFLTVVREGKRKSVASPVRKTSASLMNTLTSWKTIRKALPKVKKVPRLLRSQGSHQRKRLAIPGTHGKRYAVAVSDIAQSHELQVCTWGLSGGHRRCHRRIEFASTTFLPLPGSLSPRNYSLVRAGSCQSENQRH